MCYTIIFHKFTLESEHPDSFIAIGAVHDHLHGCPLESESYDSFVAV